MRASFAPPCPGRSRLVRHIARRETGVLRRPMRNCDRRLGRASARFTPTSLAPIISLASAALKDKARDPFSGSSSSQHEAGDATGEIEPQSRRRCLTASAIVLSIHRAASSCRSHGNSETRRSSAMIARSIRCAFGPACGKSDRTNSLCAMNLNTRASIEGRSGSIASQTSEFRPCLTNTLQLMRFGSLCIALTRSTMTPCWSGLMRSIPSMNRMGVPVDPTSRSNWTMSVFDKPRLVANVVQPVPGMRSFFKKSIGPAANAFRAKRLRTADLPHPGRPLIETILR